LSLKCELALEVRGPCCWYEKFELDEPTSGLNPVSRDGLLELFRELIEQGERSILYSTQIVSDLEKCTDFITYLKNGRIVESDEKEAFLGRYRLVRGTKVQLTDRLRKTLIGYRENAFRFTGLMRTAALPPIRTVAQLSRSEIIELVRQYYDS
jgi:ABC-2 type transport system ATP-binding protein